MFCRHKTLDLIVMFWRLQARILMLLAYRLPARKPIGKSHQNGDDLKQAMRQSYPPSRFNPAAFALSFHVTVKTSQLNYYQHYIKS